MNLKVGDVVTNCFNEPLLVTRVPKNTDICPHYSFLYDNGMVDEEYKGDIDKLFEIIGHIDGVEELLAKIARFK